MGLGTSHEREKIFNAAINGTLSRTLITSGTVLMVVVVFLLFFGGETSGAFSFALIIGVVIGTYSSIFIASDGSGSGSIRQLPPRPSCKYLMGRARTRGAFLWLRSSLQLYTYRQTPARVSDRII